MKIIEVIIFRLLLIFLEILNFQKIYNPTGWRPLSWQVWEDSVSVLDGVCLSVC